MTTHKYRLPQAAILVYDVLRLVALAFLFAFFPPLEGVVGGGLFPYLVYLTPNALFPLMALFLLIWFWEFKNYLPLYLAGKIITVITFYVWGIVSFRAALDEASLGMDPKYIYLLLSGNFALSLGDVLSILGSWFLLRKTRLFRQENGGL